MSRCCCRQQTILADETLIFGNITNLAGASFTYAGASFSNSIAGADNVTLAWVIDRPGTLYRMRVRHNNPLAGGIQTYTTRINGVNSALVLPLDSAVSNGFDGATVVPVAEGDIITMAVNNATAVNLGLRVTVFLQHNRQIFP
jgi:hypothetical protein